MTEEIPISLKETSQVTIDIKSLVGVVALLLSIAGVYFSLTAEINQMQLDVIRLQDSNIKYLQGAVDKIQNEYDEHVDEHKIQK